MNLQRGKSTLHISRNDSQGNLQSRNNSIPRLQRENSKNLFQRVNSSTNFPRQNSSHQLQRENSKNQLKREITSTNLPRQNSKTVLQKANSSYNFTRNDPQRYFQTINPNLPSQNFKRENSKGDLKRINTLTSLQRQNSSKVLKEKNKNIVENRSDQFQRVNSSNSLKRDLSTNQLVRGTSFTLTRGNSMIDGPVEGISMKQLNRALSKGEIVSELCTSGCALHDKNSSTEKKEKVPEDLQERLLRTKSWLSSSSLGLETTEQKTLENRFLKGPSKDLLSRDSFTNLYNTEFSLNNNPSQAIFSRYR